MSKVVCEVCGNSYAASAGRCPICGTEAPNHPGNKETTGRKSGSATGKKGGKFTKSNVKKRNMAQQKQSAAVYRNTREPSPRTEPRPAKKRGGTVIATLLVLLLLGAGVYYGATYIMPKLDDSGLSSLFNLGKEDRDTQSKPLAAGVEIPCTGLSLGRERVVFSQKGDIMILDARPEPAGCTERMEFSTSDPNVVTVDENGILVAVGGGEAIVTVTCGDYTSTCGVHCTFAEETESVVEPTKPGEETNSEDGKDPIILSDKDVTLSYRGETFTLYVEGVDNEDVEWKCDDPDIVSVDNGTIKALHSGTTRVFAYYNGKSDSCIIRCYFPDDEDVGSGENESSGGGEASDTPAVYILSHIDVTLYIGSSFELGLEDVDGNPVEVEWISSNPDIASVKGNTVTAEYAGMTTVYCEIGGQKYQCIVRVYFPN